MIRGLPSLTFALGDQAGKRNIPLPWPSAWPSEDFIRSPFRGKFIVIFFDSTEPSADHEVCIIARNGNRLAWVFGIGRRRSGHRFQAAVNRGFPEGLGNSRLGEMDGVQPCSHRGAGWRSQALGDDPDKKTVSRLRVAARL